MLDFTILQKNFLTLAPTTKAKSKRGFTKLTQLAVVWKKRFSIPLWRCAA